MSQSKREAFEKRLKEHQNRIEQRRQERLDQMKSPNNPEVIWKHFIDKTKLFNIQELEKSTTIVNELQKYYNEMFRYMPDYDKMQFQQVSSLFQ